MSDAPLVRADVCFGTLVTITAVHDTPLAASAMDAAFEWFRRVDTACSRFDPASELRRLIDRVGEPVEVSDLLFEAARFALAMAEETGGAFDPTVGRLMERRGFNRRHTTGELVNTTAAVPTDVSWRDVVCDPETRTLTLRRPLVLDLGAVAKGMAVDLAAQELRECRDFAIDAGGDLYFGGHRGDGAAWTVGIRHPREEDRVIDTLHLSDAAVCTSGDYERRTDDGHHIVDPRTGAVATGLASATVVGPTAMLADAAATAAFVLGPSEGLDLCARLGVQAVLIDDRMQIHATAEVPRV